MKVSATIQSISQYVFDVNASSLEEAREQVKFSSSQWIRLHGVEIHCIERDLLDIEEIDQDGVDDRLSKI